MNSRLHILLCCLVFLGESLLPAQTVVRPERITIEDGLSQGYISCLIQDKEGFLWFGTKNGLNRYDGERFKIFTHNPDDPYSISGDWVSVIEEIGDYLLIGTSSGGLNIYHKKSQRFYKIPAPNAELDFWTTMDIGTIILDKQGKLWVWEQHKGQIVCLQLPGGFWENLPQNEDLLKEVHFNLIPDLSTSKITNDSDGFIYGVIDSNHLLKINTRSFEWEKIPADFSNNISGYNFENFEVGLMAYRHSGDNFFLFQEGQWRLVPLEGPLKIWRCEQKQKILWAFKGKEILLYENFNPNIQLLKRDAAIKIMMGVELDTRNILTDRSGGIWLGTNGQGLLKITPRQLQIQTCFIGESIYAPLFQAPNGEIILHNPIKTVLSTFPQPSFPTFLGGSWWLPAEGDIVWLVGNYDNKKLIAYELDANMRIRRSTVLVNDMKGLLAYHAATIIDKNDIWAATPTAELIHYNPATDKKETFSFQSLFSNIFDCYTLAKSPNGHWWIGTSRGLVHGIPQNEGYRFELMTTQKVKQGGLRSNAVSSLLNDPKDPNLLWIGTKGGGLHHLDSRTMEFSYLTQKDGLPNDVIYGILPDDAGRLWMSSNKGIICYDPKTGKIRNFTKADGLQDDEFNTWAYAKGPNGKMLFGGINGLNVFHPDDLLENPVAPQVWLTGLAVNNVPVTTGDSTGILENAMEYTTEITLPFSQNSFTLEFAALEFSAPGKNRFRYYLEGAEEPWAHESMENQATYLNLSPGKYTFRLMGSNSDGVWNETPTELKLTILPPWYRTSLAYLIYALLVSAGVRWFWRYQKKRLQWQHQMEIDKREAARLKDLDQAKSRLYTNITHEFRTPLTVISGIADQIEGNEDKKELISRNSEQLLNLVNQMLDLRKIESGNMRIQKIQGDIVKHLRYLTESLKSYAEMQGLTLHFLSDEPELWMDFDPEKLTRIHANLLSNAIKFTPEGGHVYVQLAVFSRQSADGDKIPSENSLLFTVRDTGRGIPADKLPHIFQRFYQVDDSSTRRGEGTGIGLTLVSELVKAMGGHIKATSTSGEGTTFSIELPITREAEREETNAIEKISNTGMVGTSSAPANIENLTDDSGADSERPVALIVEDNADVIHYLITCLKEDYTIEIAMNGAEGIEKAIAQVPDLIVSDVMMPVKDGFELCQTLKTDLRTSHIPIVLLTAKADFESRLTGLERGADAYLSKPFHQEELLVILRGQLELRKRLQQRYAQVSGVPPSNLQPETSSDLEDAFLQKIRELVEVDLSDPDFGMPQLMRGLGMSRSQIYKKVKALTGHSPSVYIRSVRLYRGKKLLETSELNISEIAYDVGFSSPAYFSKLFLEEFGVPPSETRK